MVERDPAVVAGLEAELAELQGRTYEKVTEQVKETTKAVEELGDAVEKKGGKEIKELTKDVSSSKFIKGIKALKAGIKAIMKATALGLLAEMLAPLMDLMILFQPIMAAVNALMSVFVGEILVQLMPLILILVDYIMMLLPVFKYAGMAVGMFLKWMIGEGGLIAVFTWVVDFLQGIGELIVGIISFFVGGIIDGIVTFITTLANGVGVAFDLIVGLITMIGDAFWGFVGYLRGILIAGFNIIFGVVSAVIGGFIAVVKGIINAVLIVINSFILAFNLIPLIPDLPLIPYLAEGGIVTKPTLAVIGEEGPEAVVPLGKGGGFGSSDDMLLLMYEVRDGIDTMTKQNRRMMSNEGRRKFG